MIRPCIQSLQIKSDWLPKRIAQVTPAPFAICAPEKVIGGAPLSANPSFIPAHAYEAGAVSNKLPVVDGPDPFCSAFSAAGDRSCSVFGAALEQARDFVVDFAAS